MKKDAENATAVCKTLFPRTEYGWGWDASDDIQSALVEHSLREDFCRAYVLENWWREHEQTDTTFRIILSREI